MIKEIRKSVRAFVFFFVYTNRNRTFKMKKVLHKNFKIIMIFPYSTTWCCFFLKSRFLVKFPQNPRTKTLKLMLSFFPVVHKPRSRL